MSPVAMTPSGFVGLARLGAQLGVAVVADRCLVGLGDAEQHADHLHRHLRAEVGDEVELPVADQRVEALRAVNSRIFGSSAAILRGVNIRASSLRWMSWIGGSSKISDARRDLHVGLDESRGWRRAPS